MSYRTAKAGLALTGAADALGALSSLAVGVVLDALLWRIRFSGGDTAGVLPRVALLSGAGQLAYIGTSVLGFLGVFLFASIPPETRARSLAIGSGVVAAASLVLSLASEAAAGFVYRALSSEQGRVAMTLVFSLEALVGIAGEVMLLVAMRRVARYLGGWFPTWLAALSVGLAFARLGVYVGRSVADVASRHWGGASLAVTQLVTWGARVLALAASGTFVAVVAVTWRALPGGALERPIEGNGQPSPTRAGGA